MILFLGKTFEPRLRTGSTVDPLDRISVRGAGKFQEAPEAMGAMMRDLGIDRLSVEERLQLLDEIWESLDAERGRPRLTEAQQSDLERRLIDYEADPGAGSPWAEVKARLLGQR